MLFHQGYQGKVSVLTASFPHCARDLGHHRKKKNNEIKGIHIRKEEVKLFIDYKITYVENGITFTKWLLKLINIARKVAGFKINIQNQLDFYILEIIEEKVGENIFIMN